MIKISKQRLKTPVHEIKANWHTHNYNTYNSKAFSQYPFARMMAGSGTNINMGITVVYYMKSPKKFHFVHQVMRYILGK